MPVLSDVQIESFNRDGVLCCKDLLNKNACAELAKGWQELHAGIDDSNNQRSGRFVMGDMPYQLGLSYKNPQVVAAVNDLLGPDVCVYFNRILVKDLEWNGAVPTHQDMPYYHGGLRKVSAFIPIAPFNLETGGLSFYLGSHKYGFIGCVGDHEIVPEQIGDFGVWDSDANLGDVIFADFLVWHWSEVAPFPAERPVLQVVFQPADDGSWYPGQIKAPTLVSGSWRTDRFSAYGHGINRR